MAKRKTTRRPPPTLTPEEEEREAKRKLRIAENKKKAAQQRSQEGRDAIIREYIEIGKKAHPPCRCKFKTGMTVQELVWLGAGCTAGKWVCPTLDGLRRRLGH